MKDINISELIFNRNENVSDVGYDNKSVIEFII